MQQFIDRLNLLMEEKNFTYQKLAEDLQIPYRELKRFLIDRNKDRLDILVKLALYFDVSTDFLLGFSYEKT